MSSPFVGEIRMAGFNFAPAGWAFCDGALLAISQNPTLFQLIGTLEQKAGMSSVSSAAHLGGAAVGVLAWVVWRGSNDVRMTKQASVLD